MSVVIYHNPRCSKSRQTLELLRERGIEPDIVEYLKSPPSVSVVRDILVKLDMSPRELMRRKEAKYKDLRLDDAGHTEADLVQIMTDNPILIERPIVLTHKGAAIGRPPEAVLDIL